ncbi:hypothetical protein BJP08_01340 [Corynebacterium sp. NML140438]|nr:hypothetical protein BJP08_01340 [Corynebacterium sp. NML140438]
MSAHAPRVNYSVGVFQNNALGKIRFDARNKFPLCVISIDEIAFDLDLITIKDVRNENIAINVKATDPVFLFKPKITSIILARRYGSRSRSRFGSICRSVYSNHPSESSCHHSHDGNKSRDKFFQRTSPSFL